MSAVDDAIAPSPSSQRPAGPIAQRERGRLTVSDRAARHLVEGIAERGPLRVHDVDVRIDHLDDTGVSARIELAAEYPESALSTTLEHFRRHVVDDVGRLLGRPMQRLDLVVTDLVVSVEPARRVR